MKTLFLSIGTFLIVGIGNQVSAQSKLKNNISIFPVSKLSSLNWSLGISYERYVDKQNRWMISLPISTILMEDNTRGDAFTYERYNYQINPGLYFQAFNFKRSDIRHAFGLSYYYHTQSSKHVDLHFPPPLIVQQNINALLFNNRVDFDIHKRWNAGVIIGLGYGIYTRKSDYNNQTETQFMRNFQLRVGYRF